jgi:uncharacterized membrane protein
MKCPKCQADNTTGASRCNACGASFEEASSAAPPPAASAPVVAYQSSFGDQFNAALIFWKMNLGDLAVLTLVLMLLVWIPIANIGFIAGYVRSILKVARGEGRAQVGDLFNAWDCFGNLLVYAVLFLIASLIVNIVPVLGQLASLALGFVAMPGAYLIIDRKVEFADAIKWSIASIQSRPVDWLLSYVVGSVISGVGMMLLFIGVIVTMPLGSLIMALQYENAKPN